MTMPHSPGSGMPGTPGNAPAYPGNAPVYPRAIPGNPYGDMQSAPQVAAPPSHGLDESILKDTDIPTPIHLGTSPRYHAK